MKKYNKGFTLVEIMIVVLIIGLLTAIAIPSFVRARERTRAGLCINNLRLISHAAEQLAMDGLAVDAAAVNAFVRNPLVCPSGGAYTWSATPTCGFAAPAYAPHALP